MPKESSSTSGKLSKEAVKPSRANDIQSNLTQGEKSKEPNFKASSDAKDSAQSEVGSKPQKKQKQKSDKPPESKGCECTLASKYFEQCYFFF